MRTDILGVGFDDLTMEEAVDLALTLMAAGNAAMTVTPNAEIVWSSRKNERLKAVLQSADMVLPDSIGIIYAARLLKTPLKAKLPGIDFAYALMSEMAKTGKSVYLLGAAPSVADLAAERLKEKLPGLVVAGTHDGYFEDDAPVIESINAAAPDFLMVCLGSPKQELWMSEHQSVLNVGLMAGLGGSLDVFAGTVKRAPETWQKAGLEWLYRLIREPKRAGRMTKLPLFLAAAVGKRAGLYK